MDNSDIILKIISLAGGLGTPLFFIIRAIVTSSTKTTDFDRSRILTLEKKVEDLTTRYEAIISKKDELIDALRGKVTELTIEMNKLKARIGTVEQSQTGNI